ncbi:uncharacterized protein BO97DRAFT_336551, partial [Aspergillus homomorphus CBS 101889]
RQLATWKKRAILKHLGSFCLYSDWTSLRQNLSPMDYHIFLDGILVTHLCENIISNPFFCVRTGRADGEANVSSDAFDVGLHELYETLKRVNVTKANEWRQTLTRLLHADDRGGSDDWRVAFSTSEALEAACHSNTRYMLNECEAFGVLLLEPVEAEERYRALVEIYRIAAELSVAFAASQDGFMFHLDVEQVPYVSATIGARVVTKRGVWEAASGIEGPPPVLIRQPLVERSVVVQEALVEERRRCRKDWSEANKDRFSVNELQKKLDLAMPLVEKGDLHIVPVYHAGYLYAEK